MIPIHKLNRNSDEVTANAQRRLDELIKRAKQTVVDEIKKKRVTK